MIGITAQYTPRIMPGADDAAKKLSLRMEHRNHPTEHESARDQSRHHRHRRQHQQRKFPPHVRPADDRSDPTWRRALYVIKTPAASLPPWRSAPRCGVWSIRFWKTAPTFALSAPSPRSIITSTWEVESPIFPLVRATGFNVKDWQDVILVNQVGKRFYDETKG